MATPNDDIDDSILPGTTHLVDLLGTMHTVHDTSHKDIILVPTPSDDPDDPLNWTPRRKNLHMFAIFIYCLFVGIASAAIYSVLVPISLATGLTLGDLNAGTGYMFLFFGWGCVVFQPLALQYGKRPVYLFSMFATMCVQIWAPYTTTNGQWIASKILQGLFGSPIESLCEITVADLYFAHERGYYMSLYALALTSSNIIAPLLAGFILDGMGWKWVLFWPAIGCGLGLIILFFIMEETNYDRKTVGVIEIPSNSQTPETSSLSGSPIEKTTGVDTEKGVLASETNTINIMSATTGMIYKKKTYWNKLALFSTKPRPNQLWALFRRPFVLVSLPVVVYCGFAYGCTVVWSTVMNGTSSLILSSPPYNFRPSIVGLFSLASLLGTCFGCIVAGFVGDWFIIKLARRNSGIVEAETRLWLYVFPLIGMPAALILWGVGAAHTVHWFGLAFAAFLLTACLGTTVILCVSYCVDTYGDLAGEAMTTVIVIRNTMAFGVSYGITPWITNLGVQKCFISAAFICMACNLVVFITLKWGKSWRQSSRVRYWGYVRESRKLGLGH